MADHDIRPLNAGLDGREGYYVRWYPGSVGTRALQYVVIDQSGEVEETPIFAPWDDAAMTKEQAVIHHLTQNGALSRAQADLERRRREMPEPTEEPGKPPPMDKATLRFLSDWEGEW